MNKKELIVQVAIQVFRDQGIEKTKISDIVKAAGIAQGTFYLYFPSKLALMPAIAEVMVEKTLSIVQETVQDNAPFSVKIEQIIDAIFLVTRDYHEIQALIYSGLASTEHLREWETVYAPFYKWISERLEEAREQGIIRESIYCDRTAKLVIGLVESAAEQIYLYDSEQDDQARVQKAEVNEFLIHALGIKF
ncbi:TetR family transcriptional regulator [Filibacter tadaridae]|uniref:Putative HTH-type transcriptional regulator YvdT n=1 Tax=Filibacter tadaridae TaxID=2483811 RepID=A0A3P5XFN3_9BACL|nr:TetR family transcriptional regulator [Filibacter tadaridae]VDC33561.1 putative HTH-type transcriptional regulator YvdT [Filibacter tadaridae]